MADEIARMSFSAKSAAVADLGEERRKRAAGGYPVDTDGNAATATDGKE
jgi:hypothetical protein